MVRKRKHLKNNLGVILNQDCLKCCWKYFNQQVERFTCQLLLFEMAYLKQLIFLSFFFFFWFDGLFWIYTLQLYCSTGQISIRVCFEDLWSPMCTALVFECAPQKNYLFFSQDRQLASHFSLQTSQKKKKKHTVDQKDKLHAEQNV